LLGRRTPNRPARLWRWDRRTDVKERKSDFDFLDFEEADAFLRSLGIGPSGSVHDGGCPDRVGEMVALRWREDVDLRRGRLVVQRSYSRERREFVSTKNDKIRELPLTGDAIEALRIQRDRTKGELVFPGEDGKVRDKVVNNEMANVCEAADMRRDPQPRAAAHVRVACRDARHPDPSGPRVARPRQHRRDHALRPSVQGHRRRPDPATQSQASGRGPAGRCRAAAHGQHTIRGPFEIGAPHSRGPSILT
jgi:integrase